jgi:polyferredoxin/ferredoxin
MNWNLLKNLRAGVSAAILVGLSLALLGSSSSILAKVGAWLAAVQFAPSLLALTAGASLSLASVAILVATLLMGRVYCSSICPLGALQDVITRLASWRQRKKRPLSYAKPVPQIRGAVLLIAILGIVSGWTGLIVSLLDPYSNFGRIVAELLRPLLHLPLRILPGFATANHTAAAHPGVVHWAGVWAILIPLAALGLVGATAALRGRLYCNTVCPIGTLLGLVSRFSAFRLQIGPECQKCARCARVCKAQCIDTRTGVIDNSRCVSCFNCVPVCAGHFIGYGLSWKKRAHVAQEPLVTLVSTSKSKAAVAPNYRRRAVVTGGALALASAVGSELLWASEHKEYASSDSSAPGAHSGPNARDNRPVRPPGSVAVEQFLDRCTACHLCVSACPSQVLQPSPLHNGLSGLLKPQMDYAASYCDYDCTRCGQVCPSGALSQLSLVDKRRTRVGLARLDATRCVVQTKGINCTLCIDRCPAKAIETVPFGENLRLPQVKALLCIGCGRCEYECPVQERKAIEVFGLVRETHVPVVAQHDKSGAHAHTERIGL